MMERAELGVDGPAGFALLGEDIQSGDAEFVEFCCNEPIGTAAWNAAARRAATKAYLRLKARFPGRNFSYFLGVSHPDHV